MFEKVWTEDLPKCANTSVANLGGAITEDSLTFHCKINDNAYLYGVFEPHNGLEATKFILQRMAAEIIFNQFSQASDEDIKEMLRNAFVSVEKAYIQNYDEIIAERTSLQYQLQTQNKMQISKNCDQILERLKEIDSHLSEGVTLVIALLYFDKLYVANVGSCRALLCRMDESCVFRVTQLSTDHSLANEAERQRLAALGVNVESLLTVKGVGNQASTRCLGNYTIKGLYPAFCDLRPATSEPVTSTADICGPVTIDDSCRFLVLVNSLVYQRLLEAKGSYDQINKQLAQIIVENFRKETNLKDISLSVLHNIDEQSRNNTPKYYPMTMLIRNFTFSIQSSEKCQNVRFNPIVHSKSQTLLDEKRTNESDETDRTSSSESENRNDRRALDKNKKIKGYVDFTCFYENVEKAKKNGTLPSFML